jgi:hypothetical protein
MDPGEIGPLHRRWHTEAIESNNSDRLSSEAQACERRWDGGEQQRSDTSPPNQPASGSARNGARITAILVRRVSV